MNISNKWLKEFSTLLRENGIGFLGTLKLDLIDEKIVAKLAKNKVTKVNIALECGNEEYRRKVYKRNISNKQILSVGKLMEKYNIRTWVTNIIGNPGETVDMAFETIHLNRQIKAELYVCSILVPFKGTHIYFYAIIDRLHMF